MTTSTPAKIGIVTVSDRAAKGLYKDEGGPAIEAYLAETLTSRWQALARVIPDGFESVRDTLIELCDLERCDLVLTTGGTSLIPAVRALLEERYGPERLHRRDTFTSVASGLAIVSRHL